MPLNWEKCITSLSFAIYNIYNILQLLMTIKAGEIENHYQWSSVIEHHFSLCYDRRSKGNTERLPLTKERCSCKCNINTIPKDNAWAIKSWFLFTEREVYGISIQLTHCPMGKSDTFSC